MNRNTKIFGYLSPLPMETVKSSRKAAALLLVGALLVLAGSCSDNGDSNSNNEFSIPSYVVILHFDPVAPVPPERMDEEMGQYSLIKERISLANSYNIKLSLWLGHGLAEYIENSPDRMDDLGSWIQQGHEIGIHHHSINKSTLSWDGYTSVPEDEAIATRLRIAGDVEPFGYQGDLEEYMEVFKKFEDLFGIDVKSGIANEQRSKSVSMPDDLLYSAGSGFANNDVPGSWLPNDSEIEKAFNEYISVATVNDIRRKWLTHYYIGKPENVEAGGIAFDAADPDVVFVVVAHNYGHETESYEEFIDFLHSRDPTGERSMTFNEVVESGMLPEEEISLPCVEQHGVLCSFWEGSTDECIGDWLIYEDYGSEALYRCCSGYCEASQ